MAEAKASGTTGAPKGKGGESAVAEQFTKEQVEEERRKLRAELSKEYELHVDRVRSDLNRSYNEREAALKARLAEFEAQVHESEMANLDEPKRAEYRSSVLSQRLEDLQTQLAEMQAENQTLKQIGPYVKAAQAAFGIDLSQVDLSDAPRAMESVWVAAASKSKEREQRIAELQEQMGKLQGGKQESEPLRGETTVKTPPAVVTTEAGSTPSGQPSLMDIRKAITQRLGRDKLISEEEMFDLAERPEETGVDLNTVLPALENEIASLKK